MAVDEVVEHGAAAVRLPPRRTRPMRALAGRLGLALALIVIVVAVVYLDRGNYRDTNNDGISLLDAFYYAVVSLSTTGYGDITPAGTSARLMNILVVTPARVLFLIILVGTTLEILTVQYRTSLRVNRWRKSVKDHVIICGYGTKGRSAVAALREDGVPLERIVIVERDPNRVREATALGLVAILGSGTRSEILTEAKIADARTIMIATDRDDAAVLVALTARQLTAGRVRIVAAVREAENAPLLRQSGAHHVIVSSATAGRLLGLSSSAPPLLDVVEDLLAPGQGISLAMRSAARDEVGKAPRELADLVIAVIRRGQVIGLQDPRVAKIEAGDQLAHVRQVGPAREPATRS